MFFHADWVTLFFYSFVKVKLLEFSRMSNPLFYPILSYSKVKSLDMRRMVQAGIRLEIVKKIGYF